MPIVSSTRLYIVPILARTMQFPLREKIAGEIALSEQPGKTMRKWREGLRVSQTDLAHHMRVSPGVISDYEAGGRPAPRNKENYPPRHRPDRVRPEAGREVLQTAV